MLTFSRVHDPREWPTMPKRTDYAKRYLVSDVIDAVLESRTSVLADCAKLYPALTVAIMTDPVLVLRTFNGHKRATTMNDRMARVMFGERLASGDVPEPEGYEAYAGLKGTATGAGGAPPAPPAGEPESESAELLRLMREHEDADEEEPDAE